MKYTTWKQKVSLLYWFFHDAFWRFKRPLIKSLLAEGLGIIAQAAGYALVFSFANALEKGKNLELDFVTFFLGQTQSLGLLSSIILFLFTCSAVFLYLSKKIILETAQSYERFCLKRLITLSSYLPHPDCLIANQMLFKDNLRQVLQRSTRFCGRILLRYASLATPLGWVMISGLTLLFMEWRLFLLLSVLLFGVAWWMWFISKKAVDAARQAELLKKPAQKEHQQLWQRIWQSPNPIDKNDAELMQMHSNGNYRKHQQALYARLNSTEHATLAINLLVATVITFTLMLVNVTSIPSSWSWSAFGLYLLALRYFLTNLSTVSRLVIGSLRHYPALSRYWRFVQDAKHIKTGESKFQSLGLTLSSLQDNAQELHIPNRGHTLLIHPGEVDRNMVAALIEKQIVTQSCSKRDFWFIAEPPCSQQSLRQYLALPEALKAGELSKLCTALSPASILKLQQLDLDSMINENQWQSMRGKMQSILKILAAYFSNCTILILDSRVVAFAAPILPLLKEHVLLIKCSPDISLIEGADNTPVILSDGKNLVNWCQLGWLRAHTDILDSIIRDETESKVANDMGGEDDDDF